MSNRLTTEQQLIAMREVLTPEFSSMEVRPRYEGGVELIVRRRDMRVTAYLPGGGSLSYTSCTYEER